MKKTSNTKDKGASKEEFYYEKALLKIKNKDSTSAIEELNKVLEINPEHINALLERAKININFLNYKNSSDDLEKVIKMEPGLLEAHLYYGIIKIKECKYTDAIEALVKASKSELLYKEALYLLAMLKQKLKDYTGAVKECNKLIKLKPKKARYYIIRAQCKAKLRDYSGAIDDFKKSLKIDPGVFKLLCLSTYYDFILFSQNNAHHYIKLLNKDIKKFPWYNQLYYWKAMTYEVLGRHKESENALKKYQNIKTILSVMLFLRVAFL